MKELVRFYEDSIRLHYVVYFSGNSYHIGVSEDDKNWEVLPESYETKEELMEDRPYIARYLFNKEMEDIIK